MSTPFALDAYVIEQQEDGERAIAQATLTKRLKDFCDQHGLPHDSADEILHCLLDEEPRRDVVCRWMSNFIDEWEATEPVYVSGKGQSA